MRTIIAFHIFLLLAFFCGSLGGLAQSKYFSREYQFHEYQGGKFIKPKPNGNFVIFGETNGFATGNFWRMFALEVSPQGDSLLYAEFEKEGYSMGPKDIMEAGSDYVILCNVQEPNPFLNHAYMVRIDQNSLETEHRCFLGDDTTLVHGLNSCLPLNDSTFVGAGFSAIPGTAPAYWQLSFRKFDDGGGVLWEHQYDGYDTAKNNAFYKMRPASDGGYFLLGVKNWMLLSGDEVFMKVDSTGAREWELDLFPSQDIIVLGVDFMQTMDGGFFFALLEDAGASEYIHFQKHSADMSLIRHIFPTYTYGDYFFRGSLKMWELPDSTIVMAGSHEILDPFTDYQNLQILKVDADGDELWRRSYGGDGNDYAYDLAVLEDGSLVMSGRSEELDVLGAKVWLLKTNCMGLLTEPAAAFEYEAVDEFNVQFINQSQYVYPDSIDGGHYLWNFGDGTVGDGPHPQHSYPDAAEYQVTLTAVVCSDTSVYTQTVSTTPTGIKPQARAGSITVLPPTPNPAAAGSPIRIGVEFPHFIANKTATLRLYDPNGRLLHEGRQTGSGTFSLPTSGLPAGLYLYGVEWEGNVLARGKVAVF